MNAIDSDNNDLSATINIADLVPMGVIIGAFGIQGWVKAKVGSKDVNSLANYKNILLEHNGNFQTVLIKNTTVQGRVLNIKLEGIDNRNQAELLKGAQFYIFKTELAPLELEEYYWVELIGSRVINLHQQNLGTVKSIFAAGANDVLEIDDGENNYLIPFIAIYINQVNLEDNLIIVDWELDY